MPSNSVMYLSSWQCRFVTPRLSGFFPCGPIKAAQHGFVLNACEFDRPVSFSQWSSRRWKAWTTTDRQNALSATDSVISEPSPTLLALEGKENLKEVSKKENSADPLKNEKRYSTGRLYKLPQVAQADEIVSSAAKKAKRVQKNKKFLGPAAQARNFTARQMDTLMKELTLPLNRYLKEFPAIEKLHKFEEALLDLTVTSERYNKVLGRILQLRKTTTLMGKEFATKGSRANSKRIAESVAEEGFAALENLFNKNRGVLLDLIDLARTLRKLPKLELGVSTLALVGAPNVGKSSIVKAVSSGRPEICNYPFTTRSIQMGHFYVNGRRHQITDTPGLLNRPEDERNSIELLTMATLRYLPTAVVFVLDPTGECGTSMEDQLSIRSQLKNEFHSKPWIDVFSKADLLNAKSASISKREMAFRSLPEALKVSCITQSGMETFKNAVIELFSQNPSF